MELAQLQQDAGLAPTTTSKTPVRFNIPKTTPSALETPKAREYKPRYDFEERDFGLGLGLTSRRGSTAGLFDSGKFLNASGSTEDIIPELLTSGGPFIGGTTTTAQQGSGLDTYTPSSSVFTRRTASVSNNTPSLYGLNRANAQNRNTFEKTLPKLKLQEFSGDPLEWPEWSGLFASTIGESNLSDSEKLTHLRSLLTGQAKKALSGIGYSGEMYEIAWNTLKRKFGQPHLIISSQLGKLSYFPVIKSNDFKAIVEFADAVNHFVNILQQFKYSNDMFSTSNLDLVVSKLPVDVKRRWFAHIDSPQLRNTLPHLMMFSEWLQNEASVQDRLAIGSSWDKSTGASSQDFKKRANNQRGANFGANDASNKDVRPKQTECPMKDGQHRIWQCEAFKKQNLSERYNTVKNLKLCFSCLSGLHRIKDCKANMTCGIDGCEKHHNRLLHNKEKSSEGSQTILADDQSVTVRGLLQVAPVRVFGFNSSFVDTFGICDTESSSTWVDVGLMKTLRVQGEEPAINVTGIHGTSPLECKTLKISVGKVGSNFKDALLVNANGRSYLKVGSATYDIRAMKQSLPHLRCIKYNSFDLKKVRVILGQDCYPLIRPLEYRSDGQRAHWAVKLPLGWTISGPLPVDEAGQCHHVSFVSTQDQDLADQLRKWWEIESYGTTVKVDNRSQEDKMALVRLQNTLIHTGERYQLGLLWKSEKCDLPNNYFAALGQLNSLKMRLEKDPDMNENYRKSIEKDVESGYVREVSKEELLATKHVRQWYLPHHGVMHPHKPGKLRRICNVASKHRGVSLNDALVTGPDLLQSLVGILLRFREYQFAVTADIEAMFLQVEVSPDDQPCLRFLWKDTQQSEVRVLQYMRHVFRAKSSPTCANFALQQCGQDNASTWPVAAEPVRRNFYMDDLLKSMQNVSEMKQMCLDLKEWLAKGGFNITKFVSNVKEAIPEALQSEEPTQITTVLGMKWDVQRDELELCRGFNCPTRDTWTQRQVLSVVPSIFDPIGILAPFVIRARLLLKQIWQTLGQTWDSEIANDLNDAFSEWVQQSKTLENMTVPRCFTSGVEHGERQLHIFADASEDAFCAVVYLMTQTENGSELTFVLGKSRVAPQKFMTIPKLELMAAVIAVRLKTIVINEVTLPIESIYFWTDSSTVLQWIRANMKKQQVFVANCVAEIMDGSTVDQWRHVPGQLNPADLGTRGLSATELSDSEWLTGPAWLHHRDSWPKKFEFDENEPEENAMLASENSPIEWRRFSSFLKLRNTLAWALKWRYKDASGNLTVDTINRSERALWKLVQAESFGEDMLLLEKNTALPAKSKLLSLSPFLDNFGLLRAKGRLRKADIDFNAKHPLILDSKHYVVKLYLKHLNKKNHHEGVEYIRSLVQQNFWVFGLRNCLRQIKLDCLDCKRVKAELYQPMMADLPQHRLDRVWPFENTGVDYFGPIEVTMLRRRMKRWVCLFTCLSTRAINLEVVPSLDTDSCLTAIRRFIARRGQPATMISDNGTNFVGASREFSEYVSTWNKECFGVSLAQDGIKWTFNPPSAPHFGGVWERMVRSCKRAMWNILGRQRLTEDVLITVMAQVEQLLNARPLVPNSSDINDLEALTPNHFLLGRPSVALPYYARVIDDKPIQLKKAFQASEQIVNAIWKRWLVEYLPQLQQRSKWQANPHREMTVGDLVWVWDNNSRRSHYPLGRLVKMNFSDDGISRSAVVKTTKGEFLRSLAKLILLEVR